MSPTENPIPENFAPILADLQALVQEIQKAPFPKPAIQLRAKIERWLRTALQTTDFADEKQQVHSDSLPGIDKIFDIHQRATTFNTTISWIRSRLELLLNQSALDLNSPCEIMDFLHPTSHKKPSSHLKTQRCHTTLRGLRIQHAQGAVPPDPTKPELKSITLRDAINKEKRPTGYLMLRLPNQGKIILVSNEDDTPTIVLLSHPDEDPLGEQGITWEILEKRGIVTYLHDHEIQIAKGNRKHFAWEEAWSDKLKKLIKEQTFEIQPTDNGVTSINGRRAVMLEPFAPHCEPRCTPEALKAMVKKHNVREIPGVKGTYDEDGVDVLYWESEVERILPIPIPGDYPINQEGIAMINLRNGETGEAVKLTPFSAHCTPKLNEHTLKKWVEEKKLKPIPGVFNGKGVKRTPLYWKSEVVACIPPIANENGIVTVQVGEQAVEAVILSKYLEHLHSLGKATISRRKVDQWIKIAQIQPIQGAQCIAPSNDEIGYHPFKTLYRKTDIDQILAAPPRSLLAQKKREKEKTKKMESLAPNEYLIDEKTGITTIQDREAIMPTLYAEKRIPPLDHTTLKKYIKAKNLKPIPGSKGVRIVQGGKSDHDLYWRTEVESIIPPLLNTNGEILINGNPYIAIQQYAITQKVHPKNLTRWLARGSVPRVETEYLVQKSANNNLYGCRGVVYPKADTDRIIAEHRPAA